LFSTTCANRIVNANRMISLSIFGDSQTASTFGRPESNSGFRKRSCPTAGRTDDDAIAVIRESGARRVLLPAREAGKACLAVRNDKKST